MEDFKKENENEKENLERQSKNKKVLFGLLIVLVLGIGFSIGKLSNVDKTASQKENTNLVEKKEENKKQGDKYFISKLRNAKMDDIIKVGEIEYKVINIDESDTSRKIDFVDVNDGKNKMSVIRELENTETPLTSLSFIKSKSLEEKDYGSYFNFDTANTDENEISIITIEEGTIEKNELSSKTLKIELTKENLEKIAEMLRTCTNKLDRKNENSLEVHFFMGRKSKFTLEERISICKDYLEMGLSHKDILIKYGVSNRVFYRYINRFRIHGIEGLKEVGPRNRAYTKEFKTKVINENFEGSSIDELSTKYLLPDTIVINWINQYNKGIINDYIPRGEIYTMRSPKLSKDKKMAIAKECIENGRNYKETCIKYGIKYSNLYSWVSKYQDKIVRSSDYSEEDKYKILYELSLQENKMLKAELEILKKNEEILEFLEKEE